MSKYYVFETYGRPLVIRTVNGQADGYTNLDRKRDIHTANLRELEYLPTHDPNWHNYLTSESAMPYVAERIEEY